jgi:hypothetical protein
MAGHSATPQAQGRRSTSGWGRHARRARPAHSLEVNVPVPRSLVRQARRLCRLQQVRDREARTALTHGAIGRFSLEGWRTRFGIPASQKSHPQPAIHFLNRNTLFLLALRPCLMRCFGGRGGTACRENCTLTHFLSRAPDGPGRAHFSLSESGQNQSEYPHAGTASDTTCKLAC